MSADQINNFTEWVAANAAADKPVVELPGGDVSITDCAAKLFGLIGPTKMLFERGGAVMTLVRRDDGMRALDLLCPAAARSLFEKFARLMVWRSGANRELVLKPTTCPQEMADALLQSEEARTLLPRVDGLINCPVMRVVDGEAVASGIGYDPVTRLLVTGGKTVEEVDLVTAKAALLGLLGQFDFQSNGDKARAVGSLLGPGLKAGGFLKKGLPADVAEADQSQSGKTFRQKVVAAIYNEKVGLVTSRSGGVGSVDESLDQQLIAGRPFIQFDNFRGRFDSPHLEAFLTAEDSFSCRVPYRGRVSIRPENFFVMLTSNGVDTTRDLANRSNIIRIRKQPAGFEFTKFPEGDLLAHVRTRQPFYLGCVFAVIRHWHSAGQPRTDETRHDFREWARVVDWIVQNVFTMCPMMEGHQEAQERVSNPALVWLRNVALVAEQMGDLERPLKATDIFSLCENANIVIPGLREGADEDKAKRIIGTTMGKLFRESVRLEVDGYEVVREERQVERTDGNAGGSYTAKTYTVRKR